MKFKKVIDIWTQALDLGLQLSSSTSTRLAGAGAAATKQRALSGYSALIQGLSGFSKAEGRASHMSAAGVERLSSGHLLNTQRASSVSYAANRVSPAQKPRMNAGAVSALMGSTPAQRAKIQALLEFIPQASLFSKARYPRISRNRWLESSVEAFPSVHLIGTRLSAIDDDKAFNSKIQSLKDKFTTEIKSLRAAVEGKFKVEVVRLDAFGSPKLILKSLDGKTVVLPNTQTLNEKRVRGGAMHLRRAQDLSKEIKSVHKQYLSLSKEISEAHSNLVSVIGKHRRRGSTALIFTNKVFKQIDALRVVHCEDVVAGHYSPTPHLQMECFRIHSTLTARAIASHLTLINQLYNRRNNLKRRGVGMTRPASFALSTSKTTACTLPLLQWRLSMRLKSGHYILRNTVQRTTFSRVRGRMLCPQVEPIANPDGSLSMPAVAYASLLHMGDEYHSVEAARFAFTKIVKPVVQRAKALFSARSNSAVKKADWAFSKQLVIPANLQIPVQKKPYKA